VVWRPRQAPKLPASSKRVYRPDGVAGEGRTAGPIGGNAEPPCPRRIEVGDIKPAMVGVSGLALAVEAAEALHLLSDCDSSGFTFGGRSFGRSDLL
jgi:hypothetical protein